MPRPIPKVLLLTASLAALPHAAAAEGCRMQVAGARCVVVPPSQRAPARTLGPAPVEIGAILERGRYSMLLNSQYYGLEPAREGWVYMRIEDDVYRVDWRRHEVLERVTDQLSRY